MPQLLEANATQLVDVWLWECHYQHGSKCHSLNMRLLEAGVPKIYTEPFPFEVMGPKGGQANVSGGTMSRTPSGNLRIQSQSNGDVTVRTFPWKDIHLKLHPQNSGVGMVTRGASRNATRAATGAARKRGDTLRQGSRRPH